MTQRLSIAFRHRVVLGLGLFLLLPGAARAQEQEPLLDQLQARFKTRALSVGALLQIVGDWQPDERSAPGENGFSVANMRLSLGGELDHGFGYFLQANFINSPAILDARIRVKLADRLALDAGQFKTPVSAEFLTSAASIDFVNRSSVVSRLAPGRQIGAQLVAGAASAPVSARVGVFNGNRAPANGNDNDAVLVAGRLEVSNPPSGQPAGTGGRIRAGVNAAYSRDANAVAVTGLVPNFAGRRTVYGADARWTRDRWLLAAEVLGADLDFDVGAERSVYGWHGTAGYMLSPKAQVLARWDAFRPDGLAPDTDFLVLGYNRWPTRATEFQFNWLVRLNDGFGSRHQFLANLQVGF